MGLTKPFLSALFAAALCLSGAVVLRAQNAAAPPGTSAGAELQNIEKTLARPGIPAAERREALIRLARLRQLSGDIEGAAKSWLEAASSSTGDASLDDSALIAAAFCLASMGEWEQAAAALRPVLAGGREGPATRQARYLDACLKAWNANPPGSVASGGTGDASALISLADNPEYAELKSAMYYTLWKTAEANPALTGSGSGVSAETWKNRLLAEFPQSPEGRIALAEKNDSPALAISARPSPLWLLFPGRGSFSLGAAPAGVSPVPAPQVNPPQSPPSGESPSRLLQTGLFSNEANARVHAERLKSAGFSPALGQRQVNGNRYWAVTVPAGQNTNQTIRELKNAGFESFPLD